MAKRDKYAIRFGCPRCICRLKAVPAQVGAKLRCPRCQMQVEVPTVERAAAANARHEDYGVLEAEEQSPVTQQTYVTVECPLCNSVLHPTEDKIGQEITCLECDTSVLVRPPEKAPIKRKHVPVETYLLSDEVDPLSSAARPAQLVYVSLSCPLCNTLMQATGDQVGQRMVCPDCQTPVVVPPPGERPMYGQLLQEQPDQDWQHQDWQLRPHVPLEVYVHRDLLIKAERESP